MARPLLLLLEHSLCSYKNLLTKKDPIRLAWERKDEHGKRGGPEL
jgi:hypothetical protein